MDCKHWKNSSLSTLYSYVKKQIERTKILLAKESNISSAIPMILTLHYNKVRFIEGTPVVPITEFNSFLNGLEENISGVYVLYSKNR